MSEDATACHSLCSPNVDSRPVDVGFMVNVVAEENVFHRILLIFLVSIIASVLRNLTFIHNQCYRILATYTVVKKHTFTLRIPERI